MPDLITPLFMALIESPKIDSQLSPSYLMRLLQYTELMNKDTLELCWHPLKAIVAVVCSS